MRNLNIFILLLLFASCSRPKQEITFRNPSSFFPEEKTEVLLVGTFHFDYPNLDDIKVKDEDKIDVLSEPKKGELTKLIEYIKRFRPTKIAIESFPDWDATGKLLEYKKGAFQDERDERFQIAMRLAKELDLDTLYSIDAESFDPEIEKLDSLYYQNLIKDYDFDSNDPYESMYTEFFDYSNKLVSKMSILEYFKYINSKEYHQIGHGSYLIGDFKLDNLRGPDILSVWWFNRNLRIFRKLQEIQKNPTDRVLVLFGNGHSSILRDLIESSPEFDLIEFNSLDDDSSGNFNPYGTNSFW